MLYKNNTPCLYYIHYISFYLNVHFLIVAKPRNFPNNLLYYKIFQDNYIIDNNEVYYVYRVTAKRGIRNEYTHQEIIASLHVNDHDIILNNCLAVIKKNLPKNRWEEFPWLQK